jgi:hypothetical protein
LNETARRELLDALLGSDRSLDGLSDVVCEHGPVAVAVEKLRADRLGEFASLISHHWEASGMRFEAARWQRRAALNVASIKVGGRHRMPRPQ